MDDDGDDDDYGDDNDNDTLASVEDALLLCARTCEYLQQSTENVAALYVRASEVLPLRGQVRPPRSTKRWALANLRSFWLDARPQDNGEGQGPCLSWSHASADRRDERGAAPLKRLRREKLQSRRGARPTPRAGSGHRADVANNPTTTARVNETVRMGRRPRQREVYFRDAVTAAM